jgi:hypothetical protein
MVSKRDMRCPQTRSAGSAFLRRETKFSVRHYGSAGSDVTDVATKKPRHQGGASCRASQGSAGACLR